MKKNLRNGMVGLMSMALVGTPTTTLPTQAKETGTLLLKGEPEIAIVYDQYGKVMDVKGLNQEAQNLIEGYQGYQNKDAKDVLRDLVSKIGDTGYFVDDVDGKGQSIVVEVEKGSKLPNDQFMNEVMEEFEEEMYENQWDDDDLYDDDDLDDIDDIDDIDDDDLYDDDNLDDIDDNDDDLYDDDFDDIDDDDFDDIDDDTELDD